MAHVFIATTYTSEGEAIFWKIGEKALFRQNILLSSPYNFSSFRTLSVQALRKRLEGKEPLVY